MEAASRELNDTFREFNERLGELSDRLGQLNTIIRIGIATFTTLGLVLIFKTRNPAGSSVMKDSFLFN